MVRSTHEGLNENQVSDFDLVINFLPGAESEQQRVLKNVAAARFVFLQKI